MYIPCHCTSCLTRDVTPQTPSNIAVPPRRKTPAPGFSRLLFYAQRVFDQDLKRPGIEVSLQPALLTRGERLQTVGILAKRRISTRTFSSSTVGRVDRDLFNPVSSLNIPLSQNSSASQVPGYRLGHWFGNGSQGMHGKRKNAA